jgi:hypothetical protein
MCLRDGSLPVCNHPECLVFLGSFSSTGQFQTNKMLETLTSLLIGRQSILSSLYDSTRLLLDRTESLRSVKSKENNEKPLIDHPFLSIKSLELRLVPTQMPASMVYKEKGFDLTFQVFDSCQTAVEIKEIFKVKLFTSENPPKLLKLNISSKRIMRGTLESFMNDKRMVQFENIVINEVSSHYINETFTLVVCCENSSVQPFVLENLNVRARNFHKKQKVIIKA